MEFKMIVIWLVVAGIIYIPFKKWVATADAPVIAALLWPLLACLLGLFIITLPFVLAFKKIKGTN